MVLNKTLEKSLFLKNNSEYAVAFKVKTTAPKRYCVRPNSSVIKAHESMEVRIVMQARDISSFVLRIPFQVELLLVFLVGIDKFMRK